MRRFSNNLLFFVLISAVLLATALFFALMAITRRPPAAAIATATAGPAVVGAPALPQQVIVENMVVTLRTDASQEVMTRRERDQALLVPPVVVAPEAEPLLPPAGQPVITPTIGPPIVAEPTWTLPPLPTATLAPPPLPTAAPEPVIFIQYVVQSGDSLYSIAAAQNSSIELMALHDIDDADLQPGTTIRLPIANPAYCPGRRAYVVRDKDTLFRIGVQFNTTADNLRTINGLPDNTIRVTQVICVP
jgi:LysM repeat protein